MQPIGPLMIEHRLIEKMIGVIRKEIARSEKGGDITVEFIDAAVDFIRIYADKCHHGKEEDILFRDLNSKELPQELKHIMDELVEEHQLGRKAVADLVEAKKKYQQGERQALTTIIECLRYMADFYPKHIEKEDTRFFIPCMTYFTPDEKEAMLKEEYEFDKNLIHQIYREKIKLWTIEPD
ncbi:MAG: hemerythrin domain-containing protein [Candidatus Xenobiia bacterium LiM19]